MKFIAIFILFIPNLLFSEILNQFSLACLCDKNINALKYFDCKQKVSGTQLDYDQESEVIYSSFDEKYYSMIKDDYFSLNLQYETEDYISSMDIDKNLDLLFTILYKQYKKEWSYDLKCVSLKKE
ncbi:hypothetical protein N9S61_00915 [Alphaproteobacteria bacterium]|nr:hypothetical protein [Alphaproteobacteria bacterium]